MTIALMIFVLGWVGFLNPHEITGGGIAGLASVIHYAFNYIPILTHFLLVIRVLRICNLKMRIFLI